jgi:hypothetical protein
MDGNVARMEYCMKFFREKNLNVWDPVEDLHVKLKVKQSHYRPGQAFGLPGGWGSQISGQSEHKGGKVVNPTHRPPLPKENIPATHFC